jgi:hypothetical protein
MRSKRLTQPNPATSGSATVGKAKWDNTLGQDWDRSISPALLLRPARERLPLMPRRDIWQQACQWRAGRILRFTDRQNKQRKWICFAELAELL